MDLFIESLTPKDRETLATFLTEKARGIVHTAEWLAYMDELQKKFHAGERRRLIHEHQRRVDLLPDPGLSESVERPRRRRWPWAG